MAEYVTKKRVVKGEVVETVFRIDADFVPEKVSEIAQEFIENYCVAKGETDWLVDEVSITSYTTIKKGEDGVKKEVTIDCTSTGYPFVNLRSDFVQKFFPQILKSKKAKKEESFADRIKRLYGKK